MKAMILAAGRGERMRPLTDHTPKPLLPVGGKPLIIWHLERLAAAGICEVVINHAHLGEQIEMALGDGSKWGVAITYSPEPKGALETAGGIAKALPQLGPEAFLVINGDVFCDVDLSVFLRSTGKLLENDAHLLMVPNPPQHPNGDFALIDDKVARASDGETLTYAGIGLFSPNMFGQLPVDQPLKLRPLLDAAIAVERLSGERFDGRWVDVGTPERLAALDQELNRA